MKRITLILLSPCFSIFYPSGAIGATAAEDCMRLADWSADGALVVTAEIVPDAERWPAHCRVLGTIDTTINFELLLPDDWNGKFLMGGGGLASGVIQNSAQYGSGAQRPASDGGPEARTQLSYEETIAKLPLTRGYATAGTDTGHSSELPFTLDWALGNPDAVEDFAHRAVHRTAEISKLIIDHYYSEPALRSYFSGCSLGGRQALMAAQRYPADFDGVVAGSPHLDAAGWVAQSLRMVEAGVLDVLTTASADMITRSIDLACDTLDGVADGIIDDPTSCNFDFHTLPVCRREGEADCLTPEQVSAARTLFSETPGSNGQPGYPGLPFGSEIGIGREGRTRDSDLRGAEAFFKYYVFDDAEWSHKDYDVANWREDTAAASALLSPSPDLAEFRDRGGRAILWHPWSDTSMYAQDTLEFYEDILRIDPAARDFSRLFLLPGVQHCAAEEEGPNFVDWVTALERWVEEGEAPDRVLAKQIDRATWPDEPKVIRERPICAYPEIARYDGTGDPDAAESYSCR